MLVLYDGQMSCSPPSWPCTEKVALHAKVGLSLLYLYQQYAQAAKSEQKDSAPAEDMETEEVRPEPQAQPQGEPGFAEPGTAPQPTGIAEDEPETVPAAPMHIEEVD